MRKLYARYSDDKLIELAIPSSVRIWHAPPTTGSSPIAPIGWALDGWEGWLDTDGLRSIIIIDEGATTALEQSGATESEIAELKALIRDGSPSRQPATLQGLPTPTTELDANSDDTGPLGAA